MSVGLIIQYNRPTIQYNTTIMTYLFFFFFLLLLLLLLILSFLPLQGRVVGCGESQHAVKKSRRHWRTVRYLYRLRFHLPPCHSDKVGLLAVFHLHRLHQPHPPLLSLLYCVRCVSFRRLYLVPLLSGCAHAHTGLYTSRSGGFGSREPSLFVNWLSKEPVIA